MTSGPRFTVTFRTTLWLGIGYLAVLLLVVLFPNGHGITRVSTQPSATPQVAPGTCAVCGIDHVCDAKSGRCVFAETTPLPCVQGSQFDAKAGFCMPVASKTVAPAPTIDSGVFPPGIVREPRQPNLPGFGNDNGNSGQFDPFSNDNEP